MNSPDPVEELLARCLEQPEERWPDALHDVCEEHPEHAEELRPDRSVADATPGPDGTGKEASRSA